MSPVQILYNYPVYIMAYIFYPSPQIPQTVSIQKMIFIIRHRSEINTINMNLIEG